MPSNLFYKYMSYCIQSNSGQLPTELMIEPAQHKAPSRNHVCLFVSAPLKFIIATRSRTSSCTTVYPVLYWAGYTTITQLVYYTFDRKIGIRFGRGSCKTTQTSVNPNGEKKAAETPNLSTRTRS